MQIMTRLNLTDDDVVRHLHFLSCPKYKILIKELNSKFTDKMRRIRIPLPVDEKEKVIEDVDTDRRYVMDASTVWMMKNRKVLGHQQLGMVCVERLAKLYVQV